MEISRIKRGLLRLGWNCGLVNVKKGFHKIGGGWIYLNPQDTLSALYRKYDLWEPDTKEFIITHIKKGMTILEFGSCLGYFTLYFKSQVGDGGRVFAVEPDKHFLNSLGKTVRGQGINLIRKALGNKDNKDEITFGKLKEMIGNIDLVFLDIEGAETIFFDQLLKEKERPDIFVELHKNFIGDQRTKDYLEKLSKDYLIKEYWTNHYYLISKNKIGKTK